MNKNDKLVIIEPRDVGEAIAAILTLLAEHALNDRVLQRKLADALAPIVSLRVKPDDEPPRSSWFAR